MVLKNQQQLFEKIKKWEREYHMSVIVRDGQALEEDRSILNIMQNKNSEMEEST